MKARSLRVGIDARAASHPQPGGFKTYATNLLASLAATNDSVEYRVYVDQPLADMRLDQRFTVEMLPSPAIPLVGAAWREQVLLPAHASFGDIDVLHLLSGTGPVWSTVPTIVTIHDAIEQMPSAITGAVADNGVAKRRLMRLYTRYSQRRAARRAALLLTVSECSRRDIVTYLGVSNEKVRVVPEAPGTQFGRRLDQGAADEPFILGIASADPRKNLSALLRAYVTLPSELIARYRLLLVWTHPLFQKQLLAEAASQGIAGRITSIDRPTDTDLCRLYNQARVFVFPSLYEGFGLPPLEAMACGTPVIASNTSSLPEVLGDAALYADPHLPSALSRALASVLTDSSLRGLLSARGLARSRQFSWQHTAAETVAAYREVVSASAWVGNRRRKVGR